MAPSPTRFIFNLGFLVLLQSFGTHFGSVPGFTYGYRHDVYKPLRIHPYFSSLKQELSKEEVRILEDVIWNVVLYVKRVLAVIPEMEPFLLKRNACKSSWIDGRNAGKCSAIRKDYIGEVCLDKFVIPDDHLEAFYTWTQKPLPDKTWYTDGNGVSNADYILYIRASTTDPCLENFKPGGTTELIGYASYCKLGKNDRPVAGYINFCPSKFREYKDDKGKIVLTALHELFHALGFSKDLIPKFRDCSQMNETGDCPLWGFPTVRKYNSSYLLLTPSVVKEMQNHFLCTKPDFGAPLEYKNQLLQSHWNGSTLKGSIMTSTLGEPENTYVDPVTLAVFADTGWYKVNMSSADKYHYGKGSGCDTGSGSQKNIPINQCSNPLQESTCDRMNFKTIINCTDDQDQFASENQVVSNCDKFVETLFGQKQDNEHGVCMLQTSQNITQGKCFMTKCVSNGEIWIKGEETNWLQCPFGAILEIPFTDTVTKVQCPSDRKLICEERKDQIYMEDLVKFTTTTVKVWHPHVTESHLNDKYNYITDRDDGQGNRVSQSNSSSASNRKNKTIVQIIIVLLLQQIDNLHIYRSSR